MSNPCQIQQSQAVYKFYLFGHMINLSNQNKCHGCLFSSSLLEMFNTNITLICFKKIVGPAIDHECCVWK